MILTELKQKYQHHHLEKLINILQAKKYYLLIEAKQQNKLSLHILLQKNFGKTEKQIHVLKSLSLSDKTDKLKQIENMFPQDLMNDLIHDRLKEIKQLQRVSI